MSASNLPLSPTSSSSGGFHPDLTSASGLNRKAIPSDTVIPLADLESSSFGLPPTPKTPDFGLEAPAVPYANGTYTRHVHSQPGYTKNNANRRKEQNRNAQRAFRARKEKHLQDLQDRIDEMVAKQEPLLEENRCLKQLVHQLEEENLTLNTYKTVFELMASHNFLITTSPPQAEMQSELSPTFRASNGYPQSTPPSQLSSLRKNVTNNNNLDTGSHSIASQSSAHSCLFQTTPPGASQLLPPHDYPDVASILPPPAMPGYNSNTIESVEICQFPNSNYLEPKQPQPETLTLLGLLQFPAAL
ncbi:hypothetical protein PtB15_17B252 [Puccinia triticina]|nr:hypothetical protein PtB15_17B252 [Puccinia triticina]